LHFRRPRRRSRRELGYRGVECRGVVSFRRDTREFYIRGDVVGLCGENLLDQTLKLVFVALAFDFFGEFVSGDQVLLIEFD